MTAQTLDDVTFDPDEPQESIKELRKIAARQYDKDINFYKKAANLRRAWAFVIRVAALTFFALGILLLDLAAFDPGKQAAQSLANWIVNWLPGVNVSSPAPLPAGVATLVLAISALVLFIDKGMLVHRNFVAYRVTEYKLKAMRAEMLADFDEAVSKGASGDPATVFNEIKAMASRTWAAAAKEVEEETKAWGESLEKALESLRARIDTERGTARKAAAEAAKETKTAVQESKAGLLDVTIDSSKHQKDKSYEIVIEGPMARHRDTAKTGEVRGFIVSPGNAKIILMDGDAPIESKVVQIKPATKATETV